MIMIFSWERSAKLSKNEGFPHFQSVGNND